jgi:signal transduction histidine kinase
MHRVDKELLENAIELEQLYKVSGIEEFRAVAEQESGEEGIDKVFLLMMNSKLENLAESDLSIWKDLDFKPDEILTLSKGQVMYKTQSVQNRTSKIRIIYRKIFDANIIQIGFSLEDDTALIRQYSNIFGVAIGFMVIVGSFLGWLNAHRSMTGVKRVTLTADRISRGNLQHRIPLEENEGTEIKNLIVTFNSMIEKIQMLILELKEVTDNIAHDLRSPITRIRGTAETAITGKQSIEEYQKMAGMVVEECDRLIGMIATMLEIAETDSGLVEYANTPVNLVNIVHEAYEIFQPVAEDKGVSLETAVQTKPLYTTGDVVRLQRAVSNLLDNAIKYTPQGGRVRIAVDERENRVLVSVSDSGQGMDNRVLPYIFKRFYRGDSSRSESGNGLGLSLVYSIVRAHDGKITVKSKPGQGSTFTVLLPRS